jgi:nitroreductase
MDTLEAINTRRSIGRVREEAPSREEIERLIAAAVKAPNHHDTQPWRFVVLTGTAREALGVKMAESLASKLTDVEPDRAKVLCDVERVKPLRAPVLITVAVKHAARERINPTEDLQACAAGIQNMLLAAHASGLGAQWRTGAPAYDARIKEHLGFETTDEIAGFIYVGYPREGSEGQFKPRERPFAEFTEWRGE